jgi:hypothetical protein
MRIDSAAGSGMGGKASLTRYCTAPQWQEPGYALGEDIGNGDEMMLLSGFRTLESKADDPNLMYTQGGVGKI